MSKQTTKLDLDYHPKGALFLVLTATAWTGWVATGDPLWAPYGAGMGLLLWAVWVGAQVAMNAWGAR